jgi:hypothetical protein
MRHKAGGKNANAATIIELLHGQANGGDIASPGLRCVGHVHLNQVPM